MKRVQRTISYFFSGAGGGVVAGAGISFFISIPFSSFFFSSFIIIFSSFIVLVVSGAGAGISFFSCAFAGACVAGVVSARARAIGGAGVALKMPSVNESRLLGLHLLVT